MEVDISPLFCTQAQAVTLTVAQAFQMALDLWEAANAGRRNFSDISLYLVLELGSTLPDPVLGCMEERWLAAWVVKCTNQGTVLAAVLSAASPCGEHALSLAGGVPAIHAQLLCTAELLHSSGPCGTCPEQCPPHPAPMFVCTVPRAQQGHLSLAHSPACSPSAEPCSSSRR